MVKESHNCEVKYTTNPIKNAIRERMAFLLIIFDYKPVPKCVMLSFSIGLMVITGKLLMSTTF